MKKNVATFLLGAFAGGSAIAIAPREDNGNFQFAQKSPASTESVLKQLDTTNSPVKNGLVSNKLSGNKYEGSRFVERSTRRPSWENFEVQPAQEWNWNWDKRHYDHYTCTNDHSLQNTSENITKEQEIITRNRPTASRHIILIRHGQYNLEGKTDVERSLTELGTEQAQATGKRIADLNLPLSYVVSSTMTRAKETADIIRGSLPADVQSQANDSILCEGAPFPPEPRSSWKPETYYHVDGSRIEAAFRKYFHRADKEQEEDSFELVVCHANVIRYFVCRALQLPPEAWLRMSLKHGSITWITIRPDGRTSIRALGEAGHMGPDKLTTTWTVTPF